jgi:hypothetical protein
VDKPNKIYLLNILVEGSIVAPKVRKKVAAKRSVKSKSGTKSAAASGHGTQTAAASVHGTKSTAKKRKKKNDESDDDEYVRSGKFTDQLSDGEECDDGSSDECDSAHESEDDSVCALDDTIVYINMDELFDGAHDSLGVCSGAPELQAHVEEIGSRIFQVKAFSTNNEDVTLDLNIRLVNEVHVLVYLHTIVARVGEIYLMNMGPNPVRTNICQSVEQSLRDQSLQYVKAVSFHRVGESANFCVAFQAYECLGKVAGRRRRGIFEKYGLQFAVKNAPVVGQYTPDSNDTGLYAIIGLKSCNKIYNVMRIVERLDTDQ